MILLRDALKLALTKVRIRIPRLIITVIISSLLFALVIFVISVVRGAVASVDSFNSEGLSKRYLVLGSPVGDTYSTFNDPDPILIAQLEKAQKEIIARKIAEAKRLKLDYDPKTEQKWVQTSPDDGGTKYIDASTPAVEAIIDNYLKTKPSTNFELFKQNAEKAGAIGAYRLSSEFTTGFIGTKYIRVLKDNKESFEPDKGMQDPYTAKGFSSLNSGNIRTISESLVKPFSFSGQTLKRGDDGSVPVLTPFSVAEESLGLKPLLSSAKPAEKLARIKQVRESVAGTTIKVCYRNDTSSALLNSAIDQKQVDAQNKNDKKYVRPSLVYGLPKTPCGDIPIIRDVRSTEQKQLEAKQAQFDKIFGKEDPVSYILTFRIVGLLPDTSIMFPNTLTGILSTVLSSSIGGGWAVPESVAADPTLNGITTPIDQVSPFNVQFIAELPNAKAQKAFIKSESCDLTQLDANAIKTPMGMYVMSKDGSNPSEACQKQNKPFMFASFGNNAAAVDDFQVLFDKILRIVLLVLAALSSLIMMGIIGRIIADSRRETAVFRSIGATRLDMTIVYTIYALMLATLVAAVSLIFGFIIATIFSSYFEPRVTPSALLAFNSTDVTKQFLLRGFDTIRSLQVVAVVYGAALIGMLPPLIINLRRNPLRDMRDEN